MTRATLRNAQAVFANQYVPEITARSLAHFNRLDPQARHEAVQDCLCQAWANFRSAVEHGKVSRAASAGSAANRPRDTVTPASLALFANLGFGTGRRFAGSSSTDVLADRTRLMGRTQVTSLNAAGGAVHEVLAARRTERRPDRLVQTRLDWSAFRRSGLLTGQERLALDLLAQGHTNNEIAAILGVSPARSCQIKIRLAAAVTEFFGPAVSYVTVNDRGRGRRLA
jgi:ATP/maltotriose-dependent transcriptional regulator MalT